MADEFNIVPYVVRSAGTDVPPEEVQAGINSLARQTTLALNSLAGGGGTIPSGNVTYNEGATGAVTRTLTGKLQDSVSVLDFGADPTGVADSTIAIQNAINTGKWVFVPTGIYKVTALTITAATAVFGAGAGATTLKTSSATGDVVTVSAPQVYISGLGFDSSVTRTAGAFVNFTSSSNRVTLRDFYMTNYFVGVHMTASAAGRVQFGYMFGPAIAPGAGSAGILVDGGNDQYLNQITMDAPNAAQPAAGIQVTQTGALNITDCDIIHHTNDLLVNPGNGQTVASLWSINSYFDTAVRGILINPSGTGAVIRSRFTSTWTSSHSQQGILIKADGTSLIDGIEFIGHHAILNTNAGAFVQASTGTVRNIRFTAGVYSQNGAQGISFDAGISEFSVIGSRVGAGFGSTVGNAGGGIIIAAGSSNNYVLSENDVRGNTGSAISDGGSGTTKSIVDNIGYNLTTGTGVTQVFNTAPTFTGTTTFGSGAAATDIAVTNTNANGASIQMTGNGGVTPQKTIRVLSGSLGVVNSAFSSQILTLTDAGNLSVTGTVTPGSPVTPASGGTGLATLTAHALVVGEGTSNVGLVGPGTTGQMLIGVTGADPAFGNTVSTLTATGTITPSSTAGIVGTTTNDNANAGSVGEYVTANATAVSLTTATPANITSISLTAGDWDVSGNVVFTPAGTTVLTVAIANVSTTSATVAVSYLRGQSNVSETGQAITLAAPVQRVSLASTTTVFLVAQANFTTSTLTADGYIRARRVR